MPVKTERAKPLPVEDRRTSIIDAVLPLLMEQGRAVTTRQIADAAGVAEGTIFRAFGDKDSLIAAAIERFLDPEPLRTSLRSIDRTLPLEEKLRQIVVQLRERFTGVFGVMRAIGTDGPPPRSERDEFGVIITEILAGDIELLNVSTLRIAHFVRLVAAAAAIPPLNVGQEFSNDELASLIYSGVAGTPKERKTDAS